MENNDNYNYDLNIENESGNITKKENNSLFSCSKINKYYLLPFICPIVCLILYIISFYITCYIFGGLLFFIPSVRGKTQKAKNNIKVNNNVSSIKLIYNPYNYNEGKNYIIFLYLFLISLLFSICIFIQYFSSNGDKVFEKRIYLFIFIPLFSKIILKQTLYKHQILSLSLSFIGFILILIVFICIIKNNFELPDFLNNLIYAISVALHSLIYVLLF